MTEPQFNYGNFTLDELRSLAASPQVGTIQAMPASFRALADRVGEVADLLSHAQADLPNWWKGPAAEQAAATLGRAAAEAREFHGSALTAASTVSRCAQVVAAQQHQMMNVPDVPEPGITDVVERPATPLEALEAARHDAAYQAAHEQAVQVVNGIAAQYVETCNELAMITVTSGEEFAAPKALPEIPAANIGAFPAVDTASQPSEGTPRREIKGQSTNNLSTYEVPPRGRRAKSAGDMRFSVEPELEATRSRAPLHTSYQKPSRDVPERAVEEPMPIITQDLQEKGVEAIENGEKVHREINMTESLAETGQASQEYRCYGDPADYPMNKPYGNQTTNTYKSVRMSKPITHPAGRGDGDGDASNVRADHIAEPSSNDLKLSPQTTNKNLVDDPLNDSATMIPPYTGVSAAGRVRERNPRPSYLKEQKSTWLSDALAAPADGVIRPN